MRCVPSARSRLNEQAVIWFSGLRGAIALALAVEFPTAEEVVGTEGAGSFCHQREHVVACVLLLEPSTAFHRASPPIFHRLPPSLPADLPRPSIRCTIVVVLATVFLMGGFTKPVLQLCGISMGNTKAKEPPRAPGNESRRWWKRAVCAAASNPSGCGCRSAAWLPALLSHQPRGRESRLTERSGDRGSLLHRSSTLSAPS